MSRLKRVRYGAVFLPKRLRMGDWSELTARDHQVLREDVGLEPLALQLSLRPDKVRRQSDNRSKRAKSPARKKPTRYRDVDTRKPSATD